MKNSPWAMAVKESADPQRARHFFDLLAATSAASALKKISAEQARILAALFSGSPALGNLLVAHPEWMTHLEPDRLEHPRREAGLRQETAEVFAQLQSGRAAVDALARLRQFKQREMLRIAARDLSGSGDVAEITGEIS